MDERHSLAAKYSGTRSSQSPLEVLSPDVAIGEPNFTNFDDFMNYFLCFDHTTLELDLATPERPTIGWENNAVYDSVTSHDLSETSPSYNDKEDDTAIQNLATTTADWNSINLQTCKPLDVGIEPADLVEGRTSKQLLGSCSTIVFEPEISTVSFEPVLQDIDLPQWLLDSLTDESSNYFASIDSLDAWTDLNWDHVYSFAEDNGLPILCCLQDQAQASGADQDGSSAIQPLVGFGPNPAIEVEIPSNGRHTPSSLGPETPHHSEILNDIAGGMLQKSGKARLAQKPRHTQQDWQRIRPHLIRLYLHEGKTLSETREVIARQHNFSAR